MHLFPVSGKFQVQRPTPGSAQAAVRVIRTVIQKHRVAAQILDDVHAFAGAFAVPAFIDEPKFKDSIRQDFGDVP
jgi:hypothetical protein